MLKKSKRRLELPIPTVYRAKNSSTHTIPVPVFDELVVHHVVALSIALLVYPRKHPPSAKRRPSGILLIPKSLSATGKRMEYSLGVEFGIEPEWLKFVAEYLHYAVARWSSLRVARKWCSEKRLTFVQHLKQMWSEEQTDVEKPVPRF